MASMEWDWNHSNERPKLLTINYLHNAGRTCWVLDDGRMRRTKERAWAVAQAR
jgi:hypothetical protein